jgi:type III restriction enzyme
MTSSFFEQPILNSPYAAPRYHHALDEHGQPLDVPPVEGRRRSEIVTPVPMPRMRSRQGTLALDDRDATADDQEYNPTPIINEIRQHVASWRALPNPADWGVTPTSARLLTYWRSHQFSGIRPFFCQIEAVETIIWLTEVSSRRSQYRSIRAHLENGNAASNPELFRLAMKMATGAGKTTVMAMLIAWHTANAVRAPGSNRFSKGFLIVTPASLSATACAS